MAEKIAIIYNPSAGREKARRKQTKVEAQLKVRGVEYDLFETQDEAHLVETTIHCIPRYGVIIGAGGDTTINLIAHEIIRAGQGNILGVISMGSTNDLASEIGTKRLTDACAAIVEGVTRKLDVGRIVTGSRGEPYTFLAQASLGLGVAVNRYVAEWMAKHTIASRFHNSAQMTAGMAGIYNSFKSKVIPMTLELQSSTDSRTIDSPLLTFNNTSFFAARFKPSPWASPIDGKLDCCIFNSTTFAHFLKTALQIKSNKHLIDDKVEVVQDDRFTINASSPFEFQVDGEVIQADGKMEISVLPKALEVLVNVRSCTEILRDYLQSNRR